MEEKKVSDIGQEDIEKEENKAASDVSEESEKTDGAGADFEKPDDQDSGDEKSSETEEKEAADEKKDDDEEKKEPEESSDARYMRLAADFQNFKRRVEKEKKDIYQYANEKIALDIIDVMDNFERALQHNDESEDKKFAEGIDLIYKQLKNVLEKNNILEIKAEGEDFNPNFHNAIMAEDNPDYESGKVIQALQKGYTLNGKVIRASMVRVAK